MEEFENTNLENKNNLSSETDEQSINEINKEPTLDPIVVSKKQPTGYLGSTLHMFLLVFGIVFLSCTLIFQVLLTPIRVVGLSMQPTINSSALSNEDEDHIDIVYYNKDKAYQNDDVVIVSNVKQNYVVDPDVQNLIKRVIACPGQTITFLLTDIKNEQLEFGLYADVYYYDIIVKDSNGNVINLDESFIEEEMYFTRYEYEANKTYSEFERIFKNLFDNSLDMEKRYTTITVKENTYFVMGDNRNNSLDSRYFGTVAYDDISGEVKLHVPYGTNLWSAVFKKIFA